MKKYVVLLLGAALFMCQVSNAQYGRPRFRRYYRVQPAPRPKLPPFTPSVRLSFGYGFPNLDQNELFDFYHYYRGSVQQTGPVFGSLDYQFSRSTSIGATVSYGKVDAPYYSTEIASNAPDFHGKLEDWTVMLNLMHYMPGSRAVTPYLRTSAGVNIWNQNYVDNAGNKVYEDYDPPVFAYQVGLGARFNLSPQSGLFIEAGYGKYILSAGLSFKL